MNGALSLFGFVFLIAGIALFVWWLMMLIEALKTPTQMWTAAGHNQIVYVIGMFLLGWLGTILYVLIPRKDLQS